MNSPNFAPTVAPPVEQIEVSSRLHDAVQNLALNAQMAKEGMTEKSAENEAEAVRFSQHLGNVALGFNSNVGHTRWDAKDEDGKLPEPKSRAQRKELDQAQKVGERSKKAQTKVRGRQTITDPSNMGAPKKIRNTVDRLKISVNPKLSRNEKREAKLETIINPKTKKSLYEKRVNRSVRGATRKSKTVGHPKPKNAEKQYITAKEKTEEAREVRNLSKVEKAYRKSDKEVKRSARRHNTDARRSNSQREKYVTRVQRSAKIDRIVDVLRSASSAVASERISKALSGTARGLQTARNVNERLTQRAERKGSNYKDSVTKESRRYEALKVAAEQKKEDIKTYLESLDSGTAAAPETTAAFPALSREDAIEALSYSDVLRSSDPSNAAERANALKAVIDGEAGKKYTKALQELASQEGMPKLEEVAEKAIEQMKLKLEAVGITTSKYGESKTWALWDIAKQMYYVNNPGEADPDYTIANPLEDADKMQEIIDRHVGWEIYNQYAATPVGERDQFVRDHELDIDEVTDILSRPPKPRIGLSSKDLAALGAQIR